MLQAPQFTAKRAALRSIKQRASYLVYLFSFLLLWTRAATGAGWSQGPWSNGPPNTDVSVGKVLVWLGEWTWDELWEVDTDHLNVICALNALFVVRRGTKDDFYSTIVRRSYISALGCWKEYFLAAAHRSSLKYQRHIFSLYCFLWCFLYLHMLDTDANSTDFSYFSSSKLPRDSVVSAFGLRGSQRHFNCSLSICHVVLETNCNSRKVHKGTKSGCVCQAALWSSRNEMLLRGLVWICSFLKSWCLELRTLVQVTSATAFDSSLFSNQKRVSVWLSLKACPEIGSISVYARRTGTVRDLTRSRSSCPSSVDLAVYLCVWCVVFGCTTMFCACEPLELTRESVSVQMAYRT